MRPDKKGKTLRKLSSSVVVGAIAFGLNGCSLNTEQADVKPSAETLTIPFSRSVLREPLVNVVLPARTDQKVEISRQHESEDQPGVPQGTQQPAQDRVRFIDRGMLVTQPANPNGAGRVTGGKLLVPVEGDFEMSLQCAIRRLDQPTERGAHGLAIRFLFRDSAAQIVMFGCMSSQNCERCLVTRIKTGDAEKADQSMTPLSFSEGTWTVNRSGPILDLEVKSDDGDVIAYESVVAGTGKLEATEIWCTRLSQGNGHAEIELREVSLSATQFFPAEPEPRSYLTWIRWGFLTLVVATGGLAYRSHR